MLLLVQTELQQRGSFTDAEVMQSRGRRQPSQRRGRHRPLRCHGWKKSFCHHGDNVVGHFDCKCSSCINTHNYTYYDLLEEEQSLCFLIALQNIHLGQMQFSSNFQVHFVWHLITDGPNYHPLLNATWLRQSRKLNSVCMERNGMECNVI